MTDDVSTGYSRPMWKLIAAVVLVLVLPVAAEARSLPTPYLSVTESKRAVTDGMRGQLLAGFADRRPTIHVRCRKVSRAASRCRATFTADRLSGRVRARVREDIDADGSHWHIVRLGGLQID